MRSKRPGCRSIGDRNPDTHLHPPLSAAPSSIYRRYAIVDEVMLQEGGAKLAAYAETTGQR
jgi:hypothetical protein